MLRGLDLQTFSAGEKLFSKGTDADHAYLILDGDVALIAPGAGGKNLLRSRVGPNEIIGQTAIMASLKHLYHASAVTETTAAKIDRPRLMERLAQLKPFMRYWIEFMSVRLVDLERTTLRKTIDKPDLPSLGAGDRFDRESVKIRTGGEVLERRLYGPGEVIFRQGDSAKRAYLILRGQVDISVEDFLGNETLLVTLQAGQVFGEMAVFAPRPRSATAITKSECELLMVTKPQLDQRLQELDPFMRLWVESLADRIVAATRNAADQYASS